MTARPWRQELRLQPWAVIAVAVVLGAAFAFESELDLSVERSLLVLVTTIPLSVALVDPASSLTAASPTSLAWRRAVRSTTAVGVLGVAWVTILVTVTAISPAAVEPTPWWASALEWVTVAGTQLAVGSTRRRDDVTTRSIAPGAGLALVWFVVLQAAATHARLYPVAHHAVTWVVILCVAVSCCAVCSADPARRTRR